MVDFNQMLADARERKTLAAARKSSGDPIVDNLAKVGMNESEIPNVKEMIAAAVEDERNNPSLGLIGCEAAKPDETYGGIVRTDFPSIQIEKPLAFDVLKQGYEATQADFTPIPAAAPAVIKSKSSSSDPDSDDEFADYEVSEIETTGDRKMECQFITGAAGCGKTYTLRKKIEEDPKYALLCATTGIAGVNLGATTINAVLGYFDTESLNDLYVNGRLTKKIAELSKQYLNLAVDEVSMMDGAQLDTLYRAMKDVAENYTSVKHPMGLILTGDFCQLPPVKGKWAFDAQCWDEFNKNILRLTKYWRQTDLKFLDGINAARAGEGRQSAELLKQTSVQWGSALDQKFDGTTIVSKNVAVDRYNFLALQELKGKDIKVVSQRWGKLRGEWKLIPDELHVKVGAYVMILSNDSPYFNYANGDCGHIEEYDVTRKVFRIRLVRNGNLVEVPFITRSYEQRDEPEDIASPPPRWEANDWYPQKRPFKVEGRRKFAIGQVNYPPIRLAYAATVHKTQGLSLDRIQMDVRDAFFGSPGMVYVALSRARTPEGLKIVGSPDTFAGRTKVAPEVLKWL